MPSDPSPQARGRKQARAAVLAIQRGSNSLNGFSRGRFSPANPGGEGMRNLYPSKWPRRYVCAPTSWGTPP